MRRTGTLLAAVAALALALGPAIAEARPGGGFSSGSRGSRSYSAPPTTRTAPAPAQRFDRTETTPARPAQPGVGTSQPRPGQGSFAQRNPFMTGLMGGLLGAGLFGLLAGHGLFGGGFGFAGLLGLLIQIALIVLVVRLVMGFIRRRQQPATAGAPFSMARDNMDGIRGAAPGRPAGGGVPPVATGPVEIGPADYEAFERLLGEVNAAWSRQDLEALRRLSTPEMTNYFAQDLRDLQARGWQNVTRDVRLESGDLAEAWHEGGRDYATLAMRFSLVDVTTRLSDGAVVEGHPSERQTATEVWTFVRYAGEPWKLSAIQQAG